jgi:hypothetical protein
MGTRPVVVGEVPGQDAAEVSLAEDEHVVQRHGKEVEGVDPGTRPWSAASVGARRRAPSRFDQEATLVTSM